MLIPIRELAVINKAVKTKSVKDKLPEGGVWRTVRGHKVYIKDGEILAGHIKGVTDTPEAKKATKAAWTKAAKEAPAPAKKPAAKKAATSKASEAPKKAGKKEIKLVHPDTGEVIETRSTAQAYTHAIVMKDPKTGGWTTPSYSKSEAGALSTKADRIKKLDEIAKINKWTEAQKKKAAASIKVIALNEDKTAKARKDIDALAGENAKANAKVKKKTVKEAQAESKKATDEALKKPNPKTKAGKAATKADLDKVVEENSKRKKSTAKGATKEDLDKLAEENAKNKRTPKAVTKEDLDEMFGLPKSKTAKKTTKKKEVADIRTEGQKTHDVSYDVGKKIGGSKKDLAAERKALDALMDRGSGQSLDELEGMSPELAQKHCIKKNLLAPVDFEAEYKSGTEINVAMAKQLIYDRILPKPLADHPESRREYLNAIRKLQRSLEPIKTWDELREACYNLGSRMKQETPSYVMNQNQMLDYYTRKLNEKPSDSDLKQWNSKTGQYEPITEAQYKAKYKDNIDKAKQSLKAIEAAKKEPYAALGDKLMNFFTDTDSRLRTFDTVRKKKLDWSNYFKQEEEAKNAPKEKKASSNKVKWERIMPAQIQRAGGRVSKVAKPEDMVKNFGFSGIEFGHWVDDTSGNFHMKKCAEAFQDMADILGIKDKDVSFNGKLSIAFGARGKGGALAHYEPDTKAINITKEGGAGSLAHEWGHAMDNILYQESAGRSSLNLASNGMGDVGSPEIKAVYRDLMEAITIGSGDGVEWVENKGLSYYRYPSRYKEAVETVGYKQAIKTFAKAISAQAETSKAYYESLRGRYDDKMLDKKIKSAEMKAKKDKNEMVQCIAYLHEKHTGEKLDKLPLYTGMSRYYQNSKAIGGANSGYWTSNVELFARAFENYIQGKMKSGKVKNDYLVHGTWYGDNDVIPYPTGDERDKIHKHFDTLMEAVRKSGAIQKGLSYDLEKGNLWQELDYSARLKAMRQRKDPEGLLQRNRNAYNVYDTSEVFYIPVNRLKTKYQTEAALDFDKIRENVERMKMGENLEPVVIGYDYDIHDGQHRIEASRIMKYTHIPCVVGGSNELDIQRAKEAYSEVWKSIVFEALDPKAFPYEATGLMFRGIGQKELDFIMKEGYIQSKGTGNDGDQGCAVTCFAPIFTQAEGYARSQYDLYHEKQAYVLAVERPLASEENELGEIEVAGKIPADMIKGVMAIVDPDAGLEKAISRKDAKGVHKDLPEGGAWRTMNGHHIYIKDGKVLAGSIPGVTEGKAKKATKAQLKEHQDRIDKEAKKKAPAKKTAKKPSEAVQKKEKPMYSNNKRGTNQSDPQNLKGEGNMKGKDAGTNGKEARANRGDTKKAGQNEAGHNKGNDGSRIQQGGSGSASGSLHVAYNVVKDPKVFHNAIAQAKANNDHGAFVDLHDLDDYKNDKLLMSPHGGAGVAVTPDGNIISVFKDPKGTEKGAMHSIMMNALEHKGNKLDCFNGFLPRMYAKYGMVPVAKLKFNREYAPEGWNFERDGEPDVIFMAHNGDSVEEVSKKFGEYPAVDLDKVPYVEEYDDGIKAQESYLKKNKRGTNPQNKGENKMKKETAKKTPTKPVKEDLSKLSNEDIENKWRELESKHEAEAEAKYAPQIKDLKQKEKILRLDMSDARAMRKSKKKDAEIARLDKEISDNMKSQQNLFEAQMEHSRQGRGTDLHKELVKRRERAWREDDGTLLPEEVAELDKKVGAKAFDPKASEEYFYRNHGKNGWDKRAVAATPVDLGNGIAGFITHREDNSEVIVHEAKSGIPIVQHYPRSSDSASLEDIKTHAVNQAKLKLSRSTDAKQYFDNVVKQYGASPRYNDNGEVKKDKATKKARSKAEPKAENMFHIYTKEGYKPVKDGKKVDIGHGFEGFVHKHESGGYTVSEGTTGLSMVQPVQTKEEAIEAAKAFTEKHHERLQGMLDVHIGKNGKSPKYNK